MENDRNPVFDASGLDAEELTELMDTLPQTWERLDQARADICDGRTFPLDKLTAGRAARD